MSAQLILFGMLTGWEIVAVLAVVLLLFGAKRLPNLARGLGQGIREFRKSSADDPQDDKKKTEFI